MLEALKVGAGRSEEVTRELVREEVILWEDFRCFVMKHFGCAEAPVQAPVTRINLYMYDGQDPPGPCVRRIEMEVSDIDPRLAGGGSEGDDLTATLHTRWPNAAIQVCSPAITAL